MYPDIGELLGLPLRSYGLFSTLGLVCGVVIAYRAGLAAGIARRRLIDLMLWVLIGSFIGAKLLLIIVNASATSATPWAWIELGGRARRLPSVLLLWRGGLVYYGGLIAGLLVGAWYCRRKQISFARAADAILPGLALGHVWGRFGCFLTGCCFGKAGGGSLGVSFGDGSQAYAVHESMGLLPPPYTSTHPLHPVQLYEACGELALAGLLILWLGPRRAKAGQLTLTYLSCYAVLRMLFELYRGDRARGFIGDPVVLVTFNRLIGVDGGSPTFMSVSQLISLLLLITCLWLAVVYYWRRPSERAVNNGDTSPKKT